MSIASKEQAAADVEIIAPVAPQSGARNVAVDAYRGFVMVLMMAEVLRLADVARGYPGNWFWGFLAYNQTHVEWAGCSLHDTIQPGFSFLVGVALPYSIASRLRKGGTFWAMFGHALWRSFLLVALGIFLRSIHSTQTYFTFEDTLTQIGLGYPFVFLLGFRSPRWQWGAFAAILFGYWLAWTLYPALGPHFDYAAVGVPANWAHNFSGFAAHWNKNSNLGNAFDQWFLNLFPRTSPFVANEGGYLTLSFIPTLATMILGLVAGRWYRSCAPRHGTAHNGQQSPCTLIGKRAQRAADALCARDGPNTPFALIPLKRFVVAGVIGIAAGLLLHFTGICPVVKRIWTPSWTLFSGGICFLFLAGFSWIIDVKGYRKWAFPLVVVGMNSIAAYLIAHLFEDFVFSSFRIHLGDRPFAVFGRGLYPLLLGSAVLLTYWLMLLWMYRRKLFLKI